MKKVFFCSLILCTMFFCAAHCFAAPPREDYQLVLADEFDGDALNTEIWGYRGGDTNRKENVRVENGILHIDYKYAEIPAEETDAEADTEQTETPKQYAFTGGGIITNHTLRYGYYEVRAKAYSGVRGLHTSFWNSGYGYGALTPKPAYAPVNNTFMEIDIFEIDSRDDGEYPKIPQCVHYFVGDHTRGEIINNGKELTFDCSEEWFVMGMEWLPDRINYYLNGELWGTVENLQEYGQAYMWLTALAQPEKLLNEDGTYDVDFDKADENGLFGSSQFDYFRYYQLPIRHTNLLGNGNFENNRPVASSSPSGYAVKGDLAASGIQKTPRAEDGICYHIHQSADAYSLSTGQEFNYLLPGKYTFKGKFKTSGVLNKARLVVYDKNGVEIAYKAISAGGKWTEVALTDIEISDYAYVAVESASDGETILSIDCLEFYRQEGLVLPESEGVRKYENCRGVDPLNGPHFILTDAVRYDESRWNKSGLLENAYYTTLAKDSEPIEVYWEIPAELTGQYRLEWRNLPSGGNVSKQTYLIELPDGTQKTVELDTSVNSADEWLSLGRYSLNAGEVLKVTLKSVEGQTGHFRVSRFRLNDEEVHAVYEAVSVMLSNCIFMYKNSPYIFEKNNEQVVPYYEDGVYYIPYQALKADAGIVADVEEDAVYITADDLKKAGYGVTVSNSLIMIHDTDALINESVLQRALKDMTSFALPQNAKHAIFVNNENVSGQIMLDRTKAEYAGGVWKDSNTPVKNTYLDSTGSENIKWEDVKVKYTLQAPEQGKYAVEFYSASYATASANMTIEVYAQGKITEYLLNQKTAPLGWHKLCVLDMDANETVNMEISSTERFMRIVGVRLAPLYDAPKVTKTDGKLSVDLGHAMYYVGKIILAENTENGVNYQFITPEEAVTELPLQDAENPYRLFFWQNMTSFKPLYKDQ